MNQINFNMDSKSMYNVSTCMVVISIVSTTVSIIALIMAFPHYENAHYDYHGGLVTILSILVTVLIGWNIYSIVDFNKRRNEIQSLYLAVNQALVDVSKWNNNSDGITEFSFVRVYQQMINIKPLPEMYDRFLNHSVSALKYFSYSKEMDACKEIVKSLSLLPKDVPVAHNTKMDCLKTLHLVPEPNKIEGFYDVVELIASLKTR